MIYRELGDQRGIGIALLTCLGVVACEQGDYASSSALLGDSLEVWRELDDRRGIADCLEGSAGLAFALRQFERGACLYGHASRLRNEMGAPLAACEQSDHDRRIASARGSFGNDAAFDWAWKEGYGMTPEEAIEYALQERAVIDDPRGWTIVSATTHPLDGAHSVQAGRPTACFSRCERSASSHEDVLPLWRPADVGKLPPPAPRRMTLP